MSSAAASAYWRVAGMSYLKYANLCADMVRAALKEPMKSNALKRETIFYRGTRWTEGKPGESGKVIGVWQSDLREPSSRTARSRCFPSRSRVALD